jgi:hypothetical protein
MGSHAGNSGARAEAGARLTNQLCELRELTRAERQRDVL